jgi:hypothetical protein
MRNLKIISVLFILLSGLAGHSLQAQNCDRSSADFVALSQTFQRTFLGKIDLVKFHTQMLKEVSQFICPAELPSCRDLSSLLHDDAQNALLDAQLLKSVNSDTDTRSSDWHRSAMHDAADFANQISTIYDRVLGAPSGEDYRLELAATPSLKRGSFTANLNIRTWVEITGPWFKGSPKEKVDELHIDITANGDGLQICTSFSNTKEYCTKSDIQAKLLTDTINCSGG